MPASISYIVCLSVGRFLAACSDLDWWENWDGKEGITVISSNYWNAEMEANSHCATYRKAAVYEGSLIPGFYDFPCESYSMPQPPQ